MRERPDAGVLESIRDIPERLEIALNAADKNLLVPDAHCRSCGSPARLEQISADPNEAVDHLVYRCTSCAELIVSARPRAGQRK